MAAKTTRYHINRGEVWERLIVVKDSWTHRVRKPESAAATMLYEGKKYIIPHELTWEGGILLSMSEFNTEWLKDGTYPFDVVATISRSNYMYKGDPNETKVVSKGTLKVSTYENISPMPSDTMAVQPLEELPLSGPMKKRKKKA